ncbi:MAG: nuclear transport factor 2 family protein [Microthrixaceae bacterium]
MTTSRPTDDELRDLVDRDAIRELQARYADVVTRRAWPELTGLFLPDAEVRIDTVTRDPFTVTGPGELGRFIGGAVERFDFFEFVILNSLVELRVGGDPDAAAARMFMCEQRRAAADGGWSTAYGLYRDDYGRLDGRWWFTGRSYRSLARSGADGGAFPFPDLPTRPGPVA